MGNIFFTDLDGVPVTHYFQWDVNQYVVINGWPGATPPVLQISNRRSGVAKTVDSSVYQDDKYSAMIPNEFFLDPDDLHIYVYRNSGVGALRTLCEVRIKVIPRKKPESFEI